MNTERLIREALEDSVEQLTCPEPDVNRLLAAGRTARRRRVGVVAGLAGVAMLVLVLAGLSFDYAGRAGRALEPVPAGPLPAAPMTVAVSRADVAGVWMVEQKHSAGYLWHFNTDGVRDTSDDPREYQHPTEGDAGPYTVGPKGSITFEGGDGPCRATATRSSEGRMILTPTGVQPHCPPFAKGETWSFIRVSPLSAAGAELVQHPHALPPTTATAPDSVSDVAGTWLLKGTGTILAAVASSSNGGEYLVDDDGDGWAEADERGTFTVGADGAVVLRPTGGAGQVCETVLDGVRTTGVTMQTQLADMSCGRLGGELSTWIRLN